MIKKTLFNALLATIVLWSVSSSAEMAPPSPPAENPHPPVTAEDKKRVAFADQVVAILLEKDLPASLKPSQQGQPPNGFIDKSLACLQDAACYAKDAAFVNELLFFRETYGKVVETRHTHVVPWSFDKFHGGAAAESPHPSVSMETAAPMRAPRLSDVLIRQLKADEYMMHVYVRFDKAGAWHNLDVIVTEDKAGNVFLRHFFVIPMQLEMPLAPEC